MEDEIYLIYILKRKNLQRTKKNCNCKENTE